MFGQRILIEFDVRQLIISVRTDIQNLVVRRGVIQPDLVVGRSHFARIEQRLKFVAAVLPRAAIRERPHFTRVHETLQRRFIDPELGGNFSDG